MTMATLEVLERKTVNATLLKVDAEVRYWEDATVNNEEDEEGTLIPCRVGDSWRPTIDIDAGVIRDWPAGTTAKIHYKVCDAGVYTLTDEAGAVVVRKDGYVPAMLSPGGSGYGDYIIMNVGEDGAIANWRVELADFQEEGD
jgi:hypothetical protein